MCSTRRRSWPAVGHFGGFCCGRYPAAVTTTVAYGTGVGRTQLRNTTVKVNGRLPFKLCHPGSAGKLNDQTNSSPVRFRKPSPPTVAHIALENITDFSPNPPKGYGGGVDTGDDGYGKANGPGPVPIDGVEGSARWPRQWPGGGRQWRRPAKTARRHAGSGTGGLGWHEFAGQPQGLSGGRVGRRRRAVRLVGEWRAIGPGRN